MTAQPEARAREKIDRQLTDAGWIVQDRAAAIVTDECHRSIYNLWRQVLEYFDAFVIGLTATPSKQTLGFFKQNLVMEYDHERAVADGVNVDFEAVKYLLYSVPAFADRRPEQVLGAASGRSKRLVRAGDLLSARSTRASTECGS